MQQTRLTWFRRARKEFLFENTEAKYACDRRWKGKIEQILQHDGVIEMDVTGKGSAMHVIIGEYKYGRYLCMPDWGIGSPLGELDDRFWNWEQLEKRIGKVDALTLSEAIKTLSKNMEDMG